MFLEGGVVVPVRWVLRLQQQRVGSSTRRAAGFATTQDDRTQGQVKRIVLIK